ncbi:hypothetical protein GDO81_001102 [Engystomops pustulosus]|uniref:Uncharacterized protein n=1 Tax=Engystomops pustulosus TaxID=76066 RepID=A0AAV7D9M2_ENGPU|nr:hypothetical protein GDO81_001102 [Engystomops pustulosus]
MSCKPGSIIEAKTFPGFPLSRKFFSPLKKVFCCAFSFIYIFIEFLASHHAILLSLVGSMARFLSFFSMSHLRDLSCILNFAFLSSILSLSIPLRYAFGVSQTKSRSVLPQLFSQNSVMSPKIPPLSFKRLSQWGFSLKEISPLPLPPAFNLKATGA